MLLLGIFSSRADDGSQRPSGWTPGVGRLDLAAGFGPGAPGCLGWHRPRHRNGLGEIFETAAAGDRTVRYSRKRHRSRHRQRCNQVEARFASNAGRTAKSSISPACSIG